MSLAVEFQTLTEMFDRVTRKFAGDSRPALMHKVNGAYQHITFSELRSRVQRFALGLTTLQIKKGEMVGLISENRPEWVVSDLAMMYLGAVNVPLYPTMTPKQIEFIFNDARVRCVIVSNQTQLAKVMKIVDLIPSLEHIIVFNEKVTSDDVRVVSYQSLMQRGESSECAQRDFLSQCAEHALPDELFTLIYTSGTTGNPKGVMLTHRNLVSNIQSTAPCFPISHDDILLSFLPLCHSYERMGSYYLALSCGATIAYAESVETVRENFLEVRPTVMTSVPRFFERLYSRIMKHVESGPRFKRIIFEWAITVGKKSAAARKLGNINPFLWIQHRVADILVHRKLRDKTGGRMRFFVSGGAALSRDLGEFFEAVGLQIIEGYGLSETSPVLSINRLDDFKFGTVGKPIPGVEIRIAADGEVLARGPNIMKGYWGDPVATSEAVDGDGWFHTGDIGVFDEDGFLVITDRKKHLFVSSGGKNIAPQPIESLFLQSKYIDQFVLVGDARMYLTALVVPDFDVIREFASHSQIALPVENGVTEQSEIRKFFDDEIAKIQKDLPNYERVRRYALLTVPFSVENGDLTPTMKTRRKFVEEKYKSTIEKMYEAAV